MAKKIFASEREINDFLRSAQAQLIEEGRKLKKRKFQNDQFKGVMLNFKLKEVTDGRKATIRFSEKAWIKVFALIHTYSTEVEWHGVVERVATDTFYIKDVLIFPHEVTGATVTSDQTAYEKWLDTLDNDTFNALRFHGHSHVNMGVTPSSVDMNYRKNILNNFGTPTASSDYFYLFLIFNKKGDISGEIYDLQNNALYSTNEITIVTEESKWLTDFLDEAKEIIKERSCFYNNSLNSNSYTPATTSNTDNYGNKYTLTTTQPKTKVGAKQTARYGSADDDDTPDPLEDDYYSGFYGYKKYGGYR